MAYHAIRDTQRMASRYAEDLEDELESWKPDHDAAMKCRDVEGHLTVFNGLVRIFLEVLDAYGKIDASEVLLDDFELDHRVERAIEGMLAACERVETAIQFFERESFTVDRAEDFRALRDRVRAHRDEARRIAKIEGRMGFRGVTMAPEDVAAFHIVLDRHTGTSTR
jgi:hypothetical protein